MNSKRRLILRAVSFTIALVMLAALSVSCGKRASDGKPKTEANTGSDKAEYPFLVHTESATWHLAAADIALLGEDAFYEGLYAILEDQDKDFADAREALKDYIPEDVPVIDIYTAFSETADDTGFIDAVYDRESNVIKLYTGWHAVSTTLLHEYVHYLTMHCMQRPASLGFYAEGVAEYVSCIACKNRMTRRVYTDLPEEETAEARSHGVWDEAENCLDVKKYYFSYASAMAAGETIGQEYFAVTDFFEMRTEEVQQNPTIWNVSHIEAACIFAYLIETYSMETVMTALSTDPDNFSYVFGKPFSRTYRDWVKWNAEKCAELGLS